MGWRQEGGSDRSLPSQGLGTRVVLGWVGSVVVGSVVVGSVVVDSVVVGSVVVGSVVVGSVVVGSVVVGSVVVVALSSVQSTLYCQSHC